MNNLIIASLLGLCYVCFFSFCYLQGVVEESHLSQFSVLFKLLNYIILGVFLLAVAVFIIRRFPKLMCLGAVIIQVAATAGLVFSWTHKVPTGTIDQQTKQWTYFSGNARHQFSLEGIFMASAIAFCGCSLFLGIVSLNSRALRKRGLSEIISLVFFGVAAYLFNYVIGVYAWKSPWYKPSFWPSQNAAKGPLHVDRGNVF